MKFYALQNGILVPESRASLSPLDSAYLYGLGVFETLRVSKGRVRFWPGHWARLRRSAGALGLKLPRKTELHSGIQRLLKANRLQEARLAEAYVRINLSQTEPNIGPGPVKDRPRLCWTILMRPFHPYPKRLYTHGAKLILIRSVPNDPLPLAGLKTTNYLSKRLARDEVRRRRADEGILLNTRGEVTEGTASNLFLIRHQTLLTPPLRSGVMPGVTRDNILRLARRLGIKIREVPLKPRDIQSAQEVFITSTLRGIMPVRQFEGKRIGHITPGPITRQLISLTV